MMLSAQLERVGIFDGAVREGFYHGYVNKMIGALYAYKSGVSGGACLQKEAGILFEDAFFLTGMDAYVCKNPREDQKIIDVLREKNAVKLCAYIENQDGNGGGCRLV